ncbi:MAG: FAD-dependent oxidoreductase [Alphaproteobacteria bacterium]|nr:FAD-dependent oxidoreductase [Alphaproteobacteria bacterium]
MVIVGAGMAGARAVIALRAADYKGPITLIGEELHLPYDRPPLSKASITSEEAPAPILLLDEDQLRSLNAIFINHTKAVKLDVKAKTVALSNGQSVAYDKLLIATGAKPRRLTIPGGEHAIVLRDFPDAEVLRAKFKPGKKIAIIGGGFIGLELAASARKLGCDVTLIEAQPRILMRGVPEAIAKIVHDKHISEGVNILTGTGLARLEAQAVHLADGRVIPADTMIAGIGAAPEVSLAAEAGLKIDNGIVCDEHLRTSAPDVYAAGDCCNFPHGMFGGRRTRLETWRSATDQANTAVANMLGGSVVHHALPWFWSDQHDLTLQIAGMGDLGIKTVTRQLSPEAFIIFHITDEGRLVGASGIGPGNSIGRDVKLTEMLIAKGISPSAAQLADPNIALKSLLKG